jgi:hypothetical protein
VKVSPSEINTRSSFPVRSTFRVNRNLLGFIVVTTLYYKKMKFLASVFV